MRVLPSAAAAAALLMTGFGLFGADWSYDSKNESGLDLTHPENAAQAKAPMASESALAHQVAALEMAQLVAWSKHDLAGYLAWYWNSPELISLVNGDEIVGYAALANQMRTAFGANPRSMGETRMGRLRVKMMGSDAAIVVASYVTTTSKHVDAIEDTSIIRHFAEGWRIVFETAFIHAQ